MKPLCASESSVKLGLLGVLTCLITGGALTGAEPNLQLDLGGGVGIDLVLIRAGDFTQGSPAEELGRGADEASRQVTISREFYLGRTAVTRGQWERFIAETGYRSEAESGSSGGFGWDGSGLVQKKQFTWRDPGFSQTSDHPVCLVTFPDAQAFCSWLERKTKSKITLPTEAQWEYACRAGTTTPWHTGNLADECTWHKGNSNNATHPVVSKPANAWGLFIGGNVSEWCLDWYAAYQEGRIIDPCQENPNLSEKPRRILRGGSWLREAKNSRSAARYRADPRSRNADIGFRIACSVDSVSPSAVVSAPPKVEVDHVDPLPDNHEVPLTNALPHSALPSPAGSFFSTLFGGMWCLLAPILLVVFFVFRRKTTNNPFVATPASPILATLHQPVRMTDDGFWIQGDWPAGTPLSVRYVSGGTPSMMSLIYQPSPNGQFVYTGKTPDSASVIEEHDRPSSVPSVTNPPFSGLEPENRDPIGSRPPIFPSAY